MPSDYYNKNIEYIRARNKLSNREYYKDNKEQILQNKRTRYKRSKQCKHSHFDALPEDVQIKIYKKKHELELLPTLNLINKFKYLNHHPNISFCMSLQISLSPCDINLRCGLLTELSNRNNIIIDLCASRIHHLFFSASSSMIQHAQRKLNIKIVMSYRNRNHACCDERCNVRFKYDCANIRFNQSRIAHPIITLEIIELLILLGIRYDDPDPNALGCLSIYDIYNIRKTRQRDIFVLGAYDY